MSREFDLSEVPDEVFLKEWLRRTQLWREADAVRLQQASEARKARDQRDQKVAIITRDPEELTKDYRLARANLTELLHLIEDSTAGLFPPGFRALQEHQDFITILTQVTSTVAVNNLHLREPDRTFFRPEVIYSVDPNRTIPEITLSLPNTPELLDKVMAGDYPLRLGIASSVINDDLRVIFTKTSPQTLQYQRPESGNRANAVKAVERLRETAVLLTL